MHAQYQRYLDQRVPRYTSYPTAPHFHGGVDGGVYRRWLSGIDDDTTLSLYLHVPFCAKLCWFCGCHTKIVRRYDPIAAYADALDDEIALVAACVPGRAKVLSIHWGGGTPTMMSQSDFKRLGERMAERFNIQHDAEIAAEIDPRTLTADRARALGEAGVTRASIGVQDFNEEVQRAINRLQSFATTATAVNRLRDNGVSRISVDLIYGLPRQDVAALLRTVDRAVELSPDRIALFGYAHVPWMKRHQRLIDTAALPDGAQRLDQFEAAAERLIDLGYRRIGLDHFACADDPMSIALDRGDLKRNFQGYTVDPASVLLGFGASAIGSLTEGYVQNAVPLKAYFEAIASGRLATVSGVALDADDRLRRDVIERLMCDSTIDLDAAIHFHGAEGCCFDRELDALRDFERDGVVRVSGRHVEITDDGRPFVRNVCAIFDRYFGHGQARHSRAV